MLEGWEVFVLKYLTLTYMPGPRNRKSLNITEAISSTAKTIEPYVLSFPVAAACALIIKMSRVQTTLPSTTTLAATHGNEIAVFS